MAFLRRCLEQVRAQREETGPPALEPFIAVSCHSTLRRWIATQGDPRKERYGGAPCAPTGLLMRAGEAETLRSANTVMSAARSKGLSAGISTETSSTLPESPEPA